MNRRYLVAIDTTQARASVALFGDEGPLVSLLAQPGGTVSETLPGLFARAVAEVPRDGLDAVAVSVGPGSATGLRIGCAFACGIADAYGARLVEVPLLEALSEWGPAGSVCAGYAGAGRVEYLERGAAAGATSDLSAFLNDVLGARPAGECIVTPDLAGKLRGEEGFTVAGPLIALAVGEFARRRSRAF
jgi:hypothetical protein